MHGERCQQWQDSKNGDNSQVLKKKNRKYGSSRRGIHQALFPQCLQNYRRGREGEGQADGDCLLPGQKNKGYSANDNAGYKYLHPSHPQYGGAHLPEQ